MTMSRRSTSLPRRAALAASAVAATAAMLRPSEAASGLWAHEYQATKTRDGKTITLAMYRKRLLAPKPGEASRPVLFLVHGSSMSARSSFDLTVPGRGEYSSMNVFAAVRLRRLDDGPRGLRQIRADRRQFRHRQRRGGPEGGDDSRSRTRRDRRGATSSANHPARCARRRSPWPQPERAGRLVLAAYTYTGKGSPTLAKRAEQVEFYRTHNTRLRDRAMIESIFTRDKPGTTDPEVPKALADAELVFGDKVPTGTYLDMTAHLPVVDPTKIPSPVAVLRGEFDGIATMEDLWDFFRQLPNGDKQFSVIAGAAHALATSRNRQAFWHVSQAFLTMPTPPAV